MLLNRLLIFLIENKILFDSKNIKNRGVLLDSFKTLENDYRKIKEHLHSFMPQYIRRTKDIKKIIKEI